MRAECTSRYFYIVSHVLILSFGILILFAIPKGSEAKAESAEGEHGHVRAQWVRSDDTEHARFSEKKGESPVQSSRFKFRFGHPVFKKVEHKDNISSKIYEYDSLEIEGLPKHNMEPGAPVLPVKPVYYLMPYNSKLLSINVSKGHKVDVDGKYLIEPAQEPVPLSQIHKKRHTPPNKQIYDSQKIYPQTACSDNVLFVEKCGYKILIFYVHPTQYHPSMGSISYYPDIEIGIETIPAGEEREREINISPRAEETIASLVINPEEVETYMESAKAEKDAKSAVSALPDAGPYDYVIITSSALKEGFRPLVDLKINAGLHATIVTTEYIFSNYSGTETGDKPDKIREFIRDAYNNWDTQWVLLGGDIEIVPERGVYLSAGWGYSDNHIATDQYYACLDGPWNGDGNVLWGGIHDGIDGGDIDLTAEVFIGRASVSNITEVENFVSKIFIYSTLYHPNYSTCVLLGEQLSADLYGSSNCLAIKKKCLPSRWDITERYDIDGGWSRSDFINDLNASCHLVYHAGHSNQDHNARITNIDVVGWSYMPDKYPGLINEYPYFIYSSGCHSGEFDWSGGDCIAEKHIVHKYGAFAVVMNSSYGWCITSGYYSLEFFHAIFKEHKIHLGEANQDSKDDNLWCIGNKYFRWMHFVTNLLGDPEIKVQTRRK